MTDNILSFVQLAIRLGASLEMKDQTGATPLFAACENGQYKLVQALLSSGSRPTTRNRSEEAPLYIAALKGHIQTVEVLLQGFEDMQIDWIVSLSFDIIPRSWDNCMMYASTLCLNNQAQAESASVNVNTLITIQRNWNGTWDIDSHRAIVLVTSDEISSAWINRAYMTSA